MLADFKNSFNFGFSEKSAIKSLSFFETENNIVGDFFDLHIDQHKIDEVITYILHF